MPGCGSRAFASPIGELQGNGEQPKAGTSNSGEHMRYRLGFGRSHMSNRQPRPRWSRHIFRQSFGGSEPRMHQSVSESDDHRWGSARSELALQ
jgi:hypothetical protein